MRRLRALKIRNFLWKWHRSWPCGNINGHRFSSNLILSPTAPSFPPCRKRWGRKGALGYVWCLLPLNLGKKQIYWNSYRPDTPHHILLRAARHIGIKSDSSCGFIGAENPYCQQKLLGSTDLHWSIDPRRKDPGKPKRFLRCRPSLRSASQEEEQSVRIRSLASQGFVS